jgi:rhodanese-related sulfurtransferase
MSDQLPDQLPEADVQSVDRWHAGGEVVLVDVREVSEYAYEHIPGAFLLPLSFLEADLFPDMGRKIVLICQVGKRSAAAQKQLAKVGVTDTVSMAGGINAWREAELELEGTRYDDADYSI